MKTKAKSKKQGKQKTVIQCFGTLKGPFTTINQEGLKLFNK